MTLGRLVAPWAILVGFAGLIGQLQGCFTRTMSQSQVDRLTQPDPNSVRQRAIRRVTLASAYFEQDQLNAAMQEARAALQIDPDFAQAYSLLGLIHQRNNAVELAQQSFETALLMSAKTSMGGDELAAIQHNYGWFLCQQGKYVNAMDQFDRAISQPSYRQPGKTWLVMGICQVRAKQFVQARISLTNALRLSPQDATVKTELAALEWREGNPEPSRQVLGNLNSTPQATAASLWLGILLAREAKQLFETETLGERLVQLFPASPQAAWWLQRKFDDK